MKRRRCLQLTAGAVAGIGCLDTVSATGARLDRNVQTETWTQQAKLSVADSKAGFGRSVALDEDRALVGVSADPSTDGSGPGSAYIFERTDDGWQQTAALTNDEGEQGDFFGARVALDGTVAAVTAFGENNQSGEDAGSGYIFEYDGDEWIQQADVTAGDGNFNNIFGATVALDGDRVIFANPFDADQNGRESVAAYLYESTDGGWSQAAKLVPDSDFGRGEVDILVSVSGERVLLGTPHDNADGQRSGSAHIFEPDGGEWSQQAKLTADDGDSNDSFGSSVALDGDRVVVGANADEDPNGSESGSAYVFEPDGDEWSQQTKLIADDGDSDDAFGVSTVLEGDRAVVGASNDEDPNGSGSGSAYVFERTGGQWSQQAKLTADDGDSDDSFGDSLALDGDRILAGAYTDEDPNGPGSGSAYIFTAETTTSSDDSTDDDSSSDPADDDSSTEDGDDETSGSDDTSAESTDDNGSGFAVFSAVSGIAGWLWWRRRESETTR